MTKEEANDRSWVDLPSEILALIKAPLLGRDSICFSAVCQTWRSISSLVTSPVRLIQPSTTLSATIQFPLLMFSGRDGSICNFYHPIHNTTYVMDVPEIATATIRFSKDGWLFMTQGDHAMFFFNPFTKERIDLPDFIRSYDFFGITFSSVPTSSDCVVFGIHNGPTDGVNFSFIRRGEDRWTTCYPDREFEFTGSHNNPVFHDGLFYCLGKNGNLGTFDPKEDNERGWTILATPKKPCVSIKRDYLAECNGKLFSVFQGHVGKWVKVFKLDQLSMSWRRVESLGDDMLFVSLTASLSARSTKAQVLRMGNKIYFPRFSGENSVFYSLVTGRFHSCGIGYSNEDYYGTTEKLHCTWIEPSFEIHSREELDWCSGSTGSEVGEI